MDLSHTVNALGYTFIFHNDAPNKSNDLIKMTRRAYIMYIFPSKKVVYIRLRFSEYTAVKEACFIPTIGYVYIELDRFGAVTIGSIESIKCTKKDIFIGKKYNLPTVFISYFNEELENNNTYTDPMIVYLVSHTRNIKDILSFLRLLDDMNLKWNIHTVVFAVLDLVRVKEQIDYFFIHMNTIRPISKYKEEYSNILLNYQLDTDIGDNNRKDVQQVIEKWIL